MINALIVRNRMFRARRKTIRYCVNCGDELRLYVRLKSHAPDLPTLCRCFLCDADIWTVKRRLWKNRQSIAAFKKSPQYIALKELCEQRSNR